VLLYVAACVVATVPFAWLSWLAVERPAQRWRTAVDHCPGCGGHGPELRDSPEAFPAPPAVAHTERITGLIAVP
jgi:peptidoglycan/LPS O-acetylase OafA/YrhL